MNLLPQMERVQAPVSGLSRQCLQLSKREAIVPFSGQVCSTRDGLVPLRRLTNPIALV